LKTEISHGNVVTHLRCGGNFNNFPIVNFLLSPMVKEFWKSVEIWRSGWQEYPCSNTGCDRQSTTQPCRHNIITHTALCYTSRG